MTAAADLGTAAGPTTPILLFDDECAVCRRVARWAQSIARDEAGTPTVDVRAIGEDPQALRRLDPRLDIWKLYAQNHLLMPDGTILLAGEAVAEVFRRSPGMAWCARLCSIHVFKLRPFQSLLDLGYVILSDVRPIFGCKSCGTPAWWARPFVWLVKLATKLIGAKTHGPQRPQRPHFTPRAGGDRAKSLPLPPTQ